MRVQSCVTLFLQNKLWYWISSFFFLSLMATSRALARQNDSEASSQMFQKNTTVDTNITRRILCYNDSLHYNSFLLFPHPLSVWPTSLSLISAWDIQTFEKNDVMENGKRMMKIFCWFSNIFWCEKKAFLIELNKPKVKALMHSTKV